MIHDSSQSTWTVEIPFGRMEIEGPVNFIFITADATYIGRIWYQLSICMYDQCGQLRCSLAAWRGTRQFIFKTADAR